MLDATLSRLILPEVVPHGHVADIEDKADDCLGLSEVAPTLKGVLCADVEGCRAVGLLEGSCEEAKVVVLPLEQARDLLHELGVGDVGAGLVAGSLVAALWCRIAEIVPQSTSHAAGLGAGLASGYVQDECVTWDLLVLLHLDDVSGLDARPVEQLEELASLTEDELLYGLLVDSISSLPQLPVVEQVDDASGDEAHGGHRDDVVVVSGPAGTGPVHDQPVGGKDAMVRQEEQVVQEDEGANDALNTYENLANVFAFQ